MSIRLGELLISHNLINEHQLKEGLHAQTVFGGRLGTNLVELGYVNEMDLAKLLSAQMNIPCVEAGDFDEIDPEVLAVIPKNLAEMHRVVPIRVEGRSVHVAMADPTNLPGIDEITFVTGMRVVPMVAPEILVVYALENYYEIKRSVRYIRAAGMAQNLSETSATASSIEQKLKDDVAKAGVTGERSVSLGERQQQVVEGYPIHQAVMDLIKARRTEDILEIIHQYVSEDFHYAAVFLFQGDTAVGSSHVGCKLSPEEFQEFTFPVGSSELFAQVWNTKEPFLGIPKVSGVDVWVFSELGIPTHRPVFCLPVLRDGAITCIILASENKKGELLDMLESYKFFAAKVAQAFQLVNLKNQILDLSQLDT